ncbi:hypothetical protein [Streptococcus hyovaginalis]
MSIIFKFILLIVIWYLCLVLFFYIKRKSDFHNGKVIQTSNLWAHSFQILLDQINAIWSLIKILLKKWQAYSENHSLTQRKSEALINVVNHLNQTIVQDLGLKINYPVTTKGVDVWIFLANNLNETEKSSLEDYFIGVLSKYTTEFALDILVIEQIAGAGWVAKFDVKPVAEAQYNRMARASEVFQEEEFDEDLDIW